METYRELSSLKISSHTACGLGNFDGVHLGHQRLIHEIVRQAKINNIESVILTFEPHPSKILFPDRADFLLTTSTQKERIIKNFGINKLIFAPFTPEFSKIDYKDFINEILIEKLKAKVVVVGFNYRFGYKGLGNPELLKEICKNKGIEIVVIPPVTYNGEVVSSTLVRTCIRKGDVKKASSLMGRPYSIEGTVVRGNGIGSKLGFPTANISLTPNIALPANGVYAVLVSWHGNILQGVANIGNRPTFEKNDITLEVHLFNFNEHIYGQMMEVFFIEKLRREIKFESTAELIKQIKNDFLKAKNILNAMVL